MKIDVATRINRPIHEVWTLAAEDFTSIQRWSASVITSVPLTEVEPVDGAPLGGRYCTFTDDPDGFGAHEAITRYDEVNHIVEFDVIPMNAPKALPLRRNHVVLTLTALGPTSTEVRWVATPQLKPHGYLLYPILKLGITKSFRGILQELKDYAEGQPASAHAGPRLRAAS